MSQRIPQFGDRSRVSVSLGNAARRGRSNNGSVNTDLSLDVAQPFPNCAIGIVLDGSFVEEVDDCDLVMFLANPIHAARQKTAALVAISSALPMTKIQRGSGRLSSR